MDKILAKILPGVRYWWSVAAGGAAGSITNYVQQVGLTINTAQVDWHKIGQVAILGAFLAVVFHWMQPPSKPATPPEAK